MKTWILVAMMAGSSLPAYAQLGGILNKAQKAQETKQKLDDLNITQEEEVKIGADVSLKIRPLDREVIGLRDDISRFFGGQRGHCEPAAGTQQEVTSGTAFQLANFDPGIFGACGQHRDE